MKAIGIALLLSALVVGGGLLSNFVSKMAVEECARQCPDNPTALSTKLAFGPFKLQVCACGVVKK